jgi:hypothetical protein
MLQKERPVFKIYIRDSYDKNVWNYSGTEFEWDNLEDTLMAVLRLNPSLDINDVRLVADESGDYEELY